MLVFRCECENVLGVDDEASKGGAGECPACGRILRVPDGLVNAHGRLRIMGTPSRATPSGAYRQIKDTKPDSVKVGPLPATDLTNRPSPSKSVPADEASTMIDTRGIPGLNVPKNVSSASTKTAAPSPKNSAPEPAATALAGKEAKEPAAIGALTAFGLPAQPDAADPVSAEPEIAEAAPVQMPVQSPPPAKTGKKNMKPQRSGIKEKNPNDPAAAVETHIDKNLATVANAAAASSKRRKAEPTTAPAPAKKSPMLFIIISVVALIVVAGVLYALGVFGGAEKPVEKPKDSDKKPPVVNKADEKTEEKKPDEKKAQEPTPPASTDVKTDGVGENKTEAKPEIKTEVKPDAKPDTKEEPKADNKAPAPADTKTEEKKPDAPKADGEKAN